MKLKQNVVVAFCISADEFILEDVTKKLGLVPADTIAKNSSVLQKTTHTKWMLKVTEFNCKCVSSPFEKLINSIKDRVEIINSICKDYRAEVTFLITIHMNYDDNPEIFLPSEIVSFARSINAEIGFDIHYCN